MADKFITEFDINKLSKSEFRQFISKQKTENKELILEYLKKFPYSAYTSQPVYDKLSDKEVFYADNARTDGYYVWYESEIYHFEKYNLKLNDDFIQYVLAQS